MITPDFVLTGNPMVKKNSRPVFRRPDGTTFVGKSERLQTAEEIALFELKQQMQNISELLPLSYPLHITCLFYRGDKRNTDLSNLLEFPADILQKAGVIENDSQIESWDGSRKLYDKERPRTEIFLEKFSSDAKE